MSQDSSKASVPPFRRTRRNHTLVAILAGGIPVILLDMAVLGLIAGSLMWAISVRANPLRPMESRGLAATLVIIAGVAPTLAAPLILPTVVGAVPVISTWIALALQPLLAGLVIYVLGRYWGRRALTRHRQSAKAAAPSDEP